MGGILVEWWVAWLVPLGVSACSALAISRISRLLSSHTRSSARARVCAAPGTAKQKKGGALTELAAAAGWVPGTKIANRAQFLEGCAEAAPETPEEASQPALNEPAARGSLPALSRPPIWRDPQREPAALAALLLELQRLQKRAGLLARLKPHLDGAAETLDAYALRFLRARKLSLPETLEMITADLEWRERVGTLDLASRPADEILTCAPAELWEWSPAWLQGEDRLGRPVIYKEWGQFYFRKIKERIGGDPARMVRYHLWCNEQCVRALGHQSVKHQRPIGQFFCVFNAAGWTPYLMSNGAMPFLKEIALLDQAHYPERLGGILVINAPRLISLVWNIVRVYLDPVTRDKVNIMSSENEWRPVLDQLIDKDQLPQTFGGDAPLEMPSGQPIVPQSAFEAFVALSPQHERPATRRLLPAAQAPRRGSPSELCRPSKAAHAKRPVLGSPFKSGARIKSAQAGATA